MRWSTIAAIAGFSLVTVAGLADARTWTDPNGRVIVDVPNGWSALDQHGSNFTYFVFGTANDECHVIAFPRETTQSLSPSASRNAGGNDANYSDAEWARVAGSITSVFPTPPQVLSRSKEADQFWPIQRAELQGQRLVHGAIQTRPGVELQTYCQTYEGADATSAYDAFIRSVRTPNDAAMQAAAEAEAAAAAQAAPAPAQQ